MGKEIKNSPDNTRTIATKIGDLSNKKITIANSKNKESDGLTAKYSDLILDTLDNKIKDSFQKIIDNSKLKFNKIADDFEKSDKNSSI